MTPRLGVIQRERIYRFLCVFRTIVITDSDLT